MARFSRALVAIADAGVRTWKTVLLAADLTDAGIKHFGNYTSELARLPFKHFRAFAKEIEAKVRAFQADMTQRRRNTPPAAFSVFRLVEAPWCPDMVMLPAGRFMMGSPKTEEELHANEGPQHEVAITRPFAMGRYAVTFEEYDHFCNETDREQPADAGWGRGTRPVINVDHAAAEAYCRWLSEVSGRLVQLPTEAQWEYVCRAGTTTPFSFGDNITTDQVNFDGNHPYAGGLTGESRRQTVPVGSLPPSDWGLYEMHGNIWEWCADGQRGYRPGSEIDPLGFTEHTERVVRGGSWSDSARNVRAARRAASVPGSRLSDLGFRCAGVQVS